MADHGGGSIVMREYRKGNWTATETMVLIEAKRMDDERRMKRTNDSEARGKPTELRWKWVEDYCWRNGCLRSQNQCNDKWDNLMRDYKKIRDYERRVSEKGEAGRETGVSSYWKLEKNERKDRNLPSNMVIQIYEALVATVERRGGGGAAGAGGGRGLAGQTSLLGGSTSNPNLIANFAVERPSSASVHLPLPLSHHQGSLSPATMLPLPPPPPAPPSQTPHQQPTLTAPHYSQQFPADSDNTSEYSDSPAKRRRRGEGTSSGGGSSSHELGIAITRSASIIAEAIHSIEEKEERRHRDLMDVHERRLRIEESKMEINKQGIHGLMEAINNLASSIRALASHKNHSPPK